MMKTFFLPIGKFLAALYGLFAVGLILQKSSEDLLGPIAGLALLIAVIFLVRPMQSGLFQSRSIAAGLFIGGIMVATLMPQTDEKIISASSGEASLERSSASDADAGPSQETGGSQAPAQNSQAASDVQSKAVESTAASNTRDVKQKSRSPFDNKSKQQLWILKTQDAVRGRLKDPKSATFRNVVFRVFRNKVPIVCGEVNARNSFGGFSGYQGFIATGDNIVGLETDFAAGEFAKSWNEACVR